MPSGGDLTTLEDVKEWLRTGANDFPPTDDGLLSRLISAVSQYIQTFINRPLALQDWIQTSDGSGGMTMPFAVFPVSAVISLSIDGVAVPPSPPASQQGLTAGYSFSPTQLSLRGYCFSRSRQNVTVTYTAGYAAIPSDISQACIELVALRYRERTRVGEVSKSAGGAETVSYSQKDMSDGVKTILKQYMAVAPISSFLTPATTQTDAAIVAGVI